VPAAYFIVGPCRGQGEGLLLAETRTAQICSAYARPEVRGKGVGTALLDRCVRWARAHGFERLFVEHETANIPGTAFWRRHFSPYLYASMRYVDSTL
jgi:GNAT superfamily N-acetyltransferase